MKTNRVINVSMSGCGSYTTNITSAMSFGYEYSLVVPFNSINDHSDQTITDSDIEESICSHLGTLKLLSE